MFPSLQLAALLSVLPSYTLASHPIPHHHRRAITSASGIASSYDFIIVGGGTAGLVLAGRLSEDSNHTVLVLEAGDSGDAVSEHINPPGNTYWDTLIGSSYDWGYKTIPQPNAGNRQLSWPRGKLLGGSSAVNGMYTVRPSAPEVDAWGALVAVPNGSNTTWTWNDLLSGMDKTETWVAPDSEVSPIANVQSAGSTRGTSGPLFASYPAYMPDILSNWLPTFQAAGIEASPNPNGGKTLGAFFANSAINPTNWTRSYSRSAYIDPNVGRSNLEIVVNATVSKIVLDQSGPLAKATAVQFYTQQGGTVQSVTANKEVILAAGAIGSPQVLLLSGIGPKASIQAAGVTPTIDLPGVGQHLQDHLSTGFVFNTSGTTAFTLYHASNWSVAGGQAQFLSYINSATAYLNLTNLMGGNASAWATSVANALDASVSLLPTNDSTIVAGYKAIYQASQALLTQSVGQAEILFSITVGANIVDIQLALQRPFSMGQLYINSSNPYDDPVIDPRALTHFADLDVLRAAAKFIRTLSATAPLSSVLTGEVTPGAAIQTDADFNTWLANNVGTEFHPSGSCAMLPLSLGGVVDTELIVYGTSNIRVVDAAVIPIEFAAHLMAPVYGIAERASTIIRNFYNLPSTTPSSSAPGSKSSTGSSTSSSQKASGALQTSSNFAILFLVGAAALTLSF